MFIANELLTSFVKPYTLQFPCWKEDEVFSNIGCKKDQSIYILIKLWSPWLYVCLFGCLFEAVHTNPEYWMAALISNNLLNLISGTVILLRSS